jgi:hypothetical protein
MNNVSLFTFAINKFLAEADRTPAQKSWYTGMSSGGKVSQIFFVYSASHDCLQLAAAAATQAKSTDAATVAKAEENLTISGDKPYVSFRNITFSPADHFVSATADDYTIINPIPKVSEGTWKSAAG